MAETQQQQGIELKLENGMVIKGDNAEEALKSAAKIIEDNVKFSRETKAQLEETQRQMAELQSRIPQAQPAASNGFDKARYYELLNQDPLLAQNYLDAARFGIDDPAKVPGYFTTMYEKVSVFEGNYLAAGFQNTHPEFPPDEESAKVMTQRVAQLINSGYPKDQGTMDLAWSQLQREGKLKPLEAQQEDLPDIPPTTSGTGGVISATEVAKFEQMSTKEQESYLRSKRLL